MTRPLAPGRLAVRKDPRHRNPDGWAVVSNEPVPHWTGRRRIAGENHAGLYAYQFKSWHSAVLRAQREGKRRRVLSERPQAAGRFVWNGARMFDGASQ